MIGDHIAVACGALNEAQTRLIGGDAWGAARALLTAARDIDAALIYLVSPEYFAARKSPPDAPE